MRQNLRIARWTGYHRLAGRDNIASDAFTPSSGARKSMAVAKVKGKLRGKQPKLSKAQEAHLVTVHLAGKHTTVEIAELFGVARSTVYRAIKRAGDITS